MANHSSGFSKRQLSAKNITINNTVTGRKSSDDGQLWIVSEYFYPCDNATGRIMTVIAGRLSLARPVNVITTTQDTDSAKATLPNPMILRIKGSRLSKDSLLQRPFRIMLLSFRLFFAILRKVKKNDTLVSVTNPTVLTFLIRFGKMMKGFKAVLIVHDVFPENMVATGLIKATNPLYHLIRVGFNKSLDQYNAVLVIGRDMEQLMKQKIRDPHKVHYIPNFAEPDNITPSDKKSNPVIRQLGLENKLVILFTGNIGRAQNVNFLCSLLLSVKQLAEVHFLFIGDGAMKEMLSEFIRENGLNNATLLPAMNRDQENVFLNAGDIGLVSMNPGLKGMGVPSKTYSYMAAAKPILAFVEPGSEIDLLVKERALGWSADPRDLDSCIQILAGLNGQWDEIRGKGGIARKTCQQYHTPEVYTSKLTEIINSI